MHPTPITTQQPCTWTTLHHTASDNKAHPFATCVNSPESRATTTQAVAASTYAMLPVYGHSSHPDIPHPTPQLCEGGVAQCGVAGGHTMPHETATSLRECQEGGAGGGTGGEGMGGKGGQQEQQQGSTAAGRSSCCGVLAVGAHHEPRNTTAALQPCLCLLPRVDLTILAAVALRLLRKSFRTTTATTTICQQATLC